MEMWLLNQHEEPICPCCRREFLVDPYDLLEEEMMERGAAGPTTTSTSLATTTTTTTTTTTVHGATAERSTIIAGAGASGAGEKAGRGVFLGRPDPPTGSNQRQPGEYVTTSTGGVAVNGEDGDDDSTVVELGPTTTMAPLTPPSNGTDSDRDLAGDNHRMSL
jgi:hypothetical protein